MGRTNSWLWTLTASGTKFGSQSTQYRSLRMAILLLSGFTPPSERFQLICMDSIPHRRFAGLRIFMVLKKKLDKAKQGYVKGAVIKERLTLEFGFSKSTAKTVVSELVEMNILHASGENNEKGDFTVLELNENFVNDFGQILEDLIIYADKYKPLNMYNRME